MLGTLVGDNEGGSSADGDGCENDWILKSSSCSECCSHQCGSEIYWTFKACKPQETAMA